jgi:U3 small nucleolar RNA-associated protein MPP10
MILNHLLLDMMYSDFFAPPREWTREKPGSKKDPKKEKAKGKGKAADSKKPKPTEPAPAEDIRDTMSRVRTDLFADDDEAEESAPTAQLSSHEKRQLALQEQIAVLEQENVGKKDWTLLGEAKSKDRPQNSLLEEDLDFEQMGKVVPIVTEDKVMGLEEIIKRRILDVSSRLRLIQRI